MMGGKRVASPEVVLRVRGLAVELPTHSDPISIVEGIDFDLHRGETLGLVGESGSGKSLTALALMQLLENIDARIHGSVELGGRDLTRLTPREMADTRGDEIAMIFQEPRQSFNPAFTVGDQIAEVHRRHRGTTRREAAETTVNILGRLGLANPRRWIGQYPHTFSGGMLQRAMLAMALICGPKVLIADEPTTALDVTIQAQILSLLRGLQAELGMAILFVTHDMGVVADICDTVAVMYAGQLVEQGPVEEIFERSLHPYTAGLLAAVPDVDRRHVRFPTSDGSVPNPGSYPEGCRFHPRCPHARPGLCTSRPIELRPLSGTRWVRCARAEEIELHEVDA